MDGRSLTVFVDDVCCLSPIYEETFKVNLLNYLVDWASAAQIGLDDRKRYIHHAETIRWL